MKNLDKRKNPSSAQNESTKPRSVEAVRGSWSELFKKFKDLVLDVLLSSMKDKVKSMLESIFTGDNFKSFIKLFFVFFVFFTLISFIAETGESLNSILHLMESDLRPMILALLAGGVIVGGAYLAGGNMLMATMIALSINAFTFIYTMCHSYFYPAEIETPSLGSREASDFLQQQPVNNSNSYQSLDCSRVSAKDLPMGMN
jgi:hypothetical protein